MTLFNFLTIIPAITCVAPTITNGQINDTESGPYSVNARVSFLCNYGYKLDGSNSSTCTIYGFWNPQPATCTQGNEMYRLY